MPISENVDVDDLSYIDEKDVKMEFYRSSGAGGQVRARLLLPFPDASC